MGGALLLLAYPTLGAAAQLIHLGMGLWVTEALLFFGLPFALLRYSGRDPIRFAGLRFPGAACCWMGLGAGLLNYFAAVVPLQYLSTSILPEKLLQTFDQSRIFAQPTGIDLAIILLGVLVAAPLGEEFFFRGVLQRALMRKPQGASERGLSPAWTLLWVSLVFSAFHFDPVGFLARWELGILFGILALRTRSLWPGIFAHSANNGISTALYFLTRGSGSGENPGVGVILGISALGCAGLGALFWVGRKFPAVWANRHPAEDVPLPVTQPLWKLFLPWVGGSILAMAAVWAVDPKGVRLNLVDQRLPLPAPPKENSREAEEEELARGGLMAIRAKARKGELPVEFYEAQRRALQARTSPAPSGKRGPRQEKGDFQAQEEAVEVHLVRPESSPKVESEEEAKRLDDLEERIVQGVARSGAGKVDAKESSPKQRVLYLYGPDADALTRAVRENLHGAPVPKDSYLRIRSGGPQAPFRAEPLNPD